MACDPCAVKWRGNHLPCWLCGGEGVQVAPTVIVASMRWDAEQVVVG
jgi:hypothetical protein